MAWDKPLDIITMFVSGNNLSAADDRFLFVKCGTGKDTVVPCVVGNVPLGVNYGINRNARRVEIVTGGVVKLRLGGTVRQGNMLKASSDGRAVKSTNVGAYGAMALQRGDAGDLIAALLLQGHGS